MTTQKRDRLIYQRKVYSIIAIQNEWPFEPEDEGFTPTAMMTSCWRGYYSEYKVNQEKLCLSKMNIFLGDKEAPVWMGIQPKNSEFFWDCSWEYEDINLPIDYTGGVIIGRDFINEFYMQAGYQGAYYFKDVMELIFDKGKLVESIDHRERMEEVREKIKSVETNPHAKENHHDLVRFIEESFSLDYREKWEE